MFVFETVEEVVEMIEKQAAKARSNIGKTRTKLESNELKGEVYAYNEAIYFLREYLRYQEMKKNGSPDTVEPVGTAAS